MNLLDLCTEPLVDPRQISPTGDPIPFIQGTQSASRHASAMTALQLREVWTARQSAYLQLMASGDAMTDHEAAASLGWALSSINSVRGGLEKAARQQGKPPVFEADGFDLHSYTDQSGKARTSTRTRWKLRRREDG